MKFSQFVVVFGIISVFETFWFSSLSKCTCRNYTQNHFSAWDIQVHTEGSKKEIKPTWKFILEQWYNNRPKMA